jgi:tetratricopeptide (TPR) repeat protein
MAQVFLTRGDLDRALSLYQESTELSEQLGDKKGKAASLSNMAQVFLTRGDLDRALSLYQESTELSEQLGDKQGKAASLSQLANLYMIKKDWDKAESVISQSLELCKQLGQIDAIAFNIVKLGQVDEARGNVETALSRYREGLVIFEKLGARPVVEKVKQMIVNLEDGAAANDDPLAQAIAQARAAAGRKDIKSAIQFQEQAVELVRKAGEGREALVTLSVMLYNLAGYYSEAERHEDAVRMLEEVVALDERTGHQDLESDRQTLEAARKMAALSPEERQALRQKSAESQASNDEPLGFEAQLQAQLAQLPPEQRAEAEAQIRKAFEEFQRMTPEQQAAVVDQGRRQQIENAAGQVRDAGLAYVRRQAPKRDVLQMLEDASRQMKAGESAGSPWLEVAALCDAIAALIKEEPVPPVPAAYASHFAAVQSEMKK